MRKQSYTIKCRGFTLVELSIVLVIIGLLIGGILIGQSMIQTAQLLKLVRQVSEFDNAVTNFKTKYKSLPGDSKFFDVAGDGDGIVEDTYRNSGTANYTRYFDYEISNFWRHLSLSGYMPQKIVYSNNASTGIKLGVNIPEAAYGKASNGKKAGVTFVTGVNNGYWFGDWQNTTDSEYSWVPVSTYNWAYSPRETMIIDNKIDDGVPTSGMVTAKVYPTDGSICYSGTSYLNNTNIECTVVIKTLLINY